MRAIRRVGLFWAFICAVVIFSGMWAAAEDAVDRSASRERVAVARSGHDVDERCRIIAEGGKVCPLPEDNLIANPWFRNGTRPSLDGWTVVRAPSGGWEPSQKLGNPTPDDVVGTAARLSTGRGAERTGRTIDPGEFSSLVQVVAADPAQGVLKFSMYWVAHTVDPVVVTVYGGPAPMGRGPSSGRRSTSVTGTW